MALPASCYAFGNNAELKPLELKRIEAQKTERQRSENKGSEHQQSGCQSAELKPVQYKRAECSPIELTERQQVQRQPLDLKQVELPPYPKRRHQRPLRVLAATGAAQSPNVGRLSAFHAQSSVIRSYPVPSVCDTPETLEVSSFLKDLAISLLLILPYFFIPNA